MLSRFEPRLTMLTILGASLSMILPGCAPTKPNELDKLGSARMTIKGKPFELWIADAPDEQEKGLMFVTSDQMTPLPDGAERGMIFIFDYERTLNFWMKNTVIPLDIAYLDTNGVVVATYTMAPLDERLGQYSSRVPARMAIEVNANVWSAVGLAAGDRIEIPATLLKR